MTLRGFIFFAIVAATHAGISEQVDKACVLLGQMGSNKEDLTADQQLALYGEFAGLFTETVDCSEDPFNPVLGYNLKGVTLMECAAAKQQRLAANPQAQIQLGTSQCIQKIIDEK